jgi:hypothetical protein
MSNEKEYIELLERIDRLEDEVARLGANKKDLELRCNITESKLTALSDKFERTAIAFAKFDFLLRDHCELLDGSVKEVWEHIRAIELKIFPNLSSGLDELNNIIRTEADDESSKIDNRRPPLWRYENRDNIKRALGESPDVDPIGRSPKDSK